MASTKSIKSGALSFKAWKKSLKPSLNSSVNRNGAIELVIEAFLDAIRTAGKPLIVHTDQGPEYNSEEYIQFMENLGVKVSMSAKASPWENGYQESFYDNFKTDLGL